MPTDSLNELRDLVVRRVGTGAVAVATDERLGLRMIAAREISEPTQQLYEPVFALLLQGQKRIILGDQVFSGRAGDFLLVSVDLPVTYQISQASAARPYVALALSLRPALVATLLLEAAALDCAPADGAGAGAGLGVSEAQTDLVDAVLRLARLLDHPRDVPVLGPIAEREIVWRLLCSEQGHRLRQIGLADSRLSQIGRAMRWMREHYQETLPVEDLARLAAMSVTSFHRHFRAVALMSPLQYLKQIRLQEARAQLLGGGLDVATIGHAVGYDSPSQFSREYKRAYGAPPGQDARMLRSFQASK